MQLPHHDGSCKQQLLGFCSKKKEGLRRSEGTPGQLIINQGFLKHLQGPYCVCLGPRTTSACYQQTGWIGLCLWVTLPILDTFLKKEKGLLLHYFSPVLHFLFFPSSLILKALIQQNIPFLQNMILFAIQVVISHLYNFYLIIYITDLWFLTFTFYDRKFNGFSLPHDSLFQL